MGGEGRNQDRFEYSFYGKGDKDRFLKSQHREIKEGHIALEGPWMLSSDPCEGLNLYPCQPLHVGKSLPGLAT